MLFLCGKKPLRDAASSPRACKVQFRQNPIQNIIDENKFTLFQAQKSSNLNSKKRWIADSLNIKGEVFIDKKAQEALKSGSSLLPVGVTKILGNFEAGDVILIKNSTQDSIGSGVSSYSSSNLEKIIGKKSKEISSILGYEGRDEIIHKDDLVKIIS